MSSISVPPLVRSAFRSLSIRDILACPRILEFYMHRQRSPPSFVEKRNIRMGNCAGFSLTWCWEFIGLGFSAGYLFWYGMYRLSLSTSIRSSKFSIYLSSNYSQPRSTRTPSTPYLHNSMLSRSRTRNPLRSLHQNHFTHGNYGNS